MKSLREQYNEHMAGFSPAIDDLPGDLREIAESIAEEWPDKAVAITLHLYARFPKVHVYFHNTDGLLKKHREAWIRSLPRKQGNNRISARDIALVTGLSEREVEKIRPTEEERQLSLFQQDK